MEISASVHTLSIIHILYSMYVTLVLFQPLPFCFRMSAVVSVIEVYSITFCRLCMLRTYVYACVLSVFLFPLFPSHPSSPLFIPLPLQFHPLPSPPPPLLLSTPPLHSRWQLLISCRRVFWDLCSLRLWCASLRTMFQRSLLRPSSESLRPQRQSGTVR